MENQITDYLNILYKTTLLINILIPPPLWLPVDVLWQLAQEDPNEISPASDGNLFISSFPLQSKVFSLKILIFNAVLERGLSMIQRCQRVESSTLN